MRISVVRASFVFRVALCWFVLAVAPAVFALDATFNSAADVGVTSNGYTASGNIVNFTLNFAPAPGTSLTVVNNTAIAFINGAFSNLSQGQAIELTYNGVVYGFVANYFGGTGNDLVLQWQGTKVMA